MRILALDVATKVGWALYDTDLEPSAMVSGSFRCGPEERVSPFIRVGALRTALPPIVRQQKPDFAALEAPRQAAPQFKKKPKKTLFSGQEPEEEGEGFTINSKTIALLNRLSGAAEAIVMGFNVPCVEVDPKTWQAILPRNIPGNTKARAKAYCDMLGIVSPNMDSRDACVIALWAAGHCQELKLLQRTRSAA